MLGIISEGACDSSRSIGETSFKKKKRNKIKQFFDQVCLAGLMSDTKIHISKS